ncbi:unnamed protein product [Caenorhabditis bovis]|uniref:FHA domain-containing protein n=1 Tax=Caenorhabditis bovis TaxID=2654633 RepID=A0A8S1F4J5_9PELO|nr:unnamed protein product [Caenorhabditis bovis]
MSGIVELIPTPKSHQFEPRRIRVGPETEPVKIGRAVGRIQAAKDNAVFDCKVLSRNHALLWYKNGEFFIKDTKSSNGTFVNTERLGGTSQDSPPRQVFSGDIIQLGVEIIENTNKVMYGCIYALIQCYDADGNLIQLNRVNDPSTIKNSNDSLIVNRAMFQMQQFISEGAYREKMREEKLIDLVTLLDDVDRASETAWKALVNEDRLLARIEALEAQLAVCSNNNTPDKQKEELLKMIDDKTKFEATTKETIRRLQEEIAETRWRMQDMERSLNSTENTCNQLRNSNSDMEKLLYESACMFDQKMFEYAKSRKELEKTKIELYDQIHLREEWEAKFKNLERDVENASNDLAMLCFRVREYLEKSNGNFNRVIIVSLQKALKQVMGENDVEIAGKTKENEEQIIDKNAESYLKETLALQATIRDLVAELHQAKETIENMRMERNGEYRKVECNQLGVGDASLTMTEAGSVSVVPNKLALKTGDITTNGENVPMDCDTRFLDEDYDVVDSGVDDDGLVTREFVYRGKAYCPVPPTPMTLVYNGDYNSPYKVTAKKDSEEENVYIFELRIPNLKNNHSGTVQIYIKVGNDMLTRELDLTFRGFNLPKPDGRAFHELDGEYQVIGVPLRYVLPNEYNFVWYKNGELVPPQRKRTHQYISKSKVSPLPVAALNIGRTAEETAGSYRVVIENSSGENYCDIDIIHDTSRPFFYKLAECNACFHKRCVPGTDFDAPNTGMRVNLKIFYVSSSEKMTRVIWSCNDPQFVKGTEFDREDSRRSVYKYESKISFTMTIRTLEMKFKVTVMNEFGIKNGYMNVVLKGIAIF